MPDRLTDERLEQAAKGFEDFGIILKAGGYFHSHEFKSMLAELLELRELTDKFNAASEGYQKQIVELRQENERLRKESAQKAQEWVAANERLQTDVAVLRGKYNTSKPILDRTEAALDAYAKHLAESEELLRLNEEQEHPTWTD